MGFIEKPLVEVVNIKTGKLNSNAAVENGEYLFFTCAPEPLRIDKFKYDQAAILLAGNNAEGNFHINYFEGKFEAYQRTYIIDSKDDNEYDLRYLFYALKECLVEFKLMSQGTSTKFLTMAILNGFKLNIPCINKQRKIAGILLSIDKKMQINNKINRNLLEQAKAIYKQMILDIPEEELHDAVLSDIAVITMGQSPSGESYNEDGNGEVFYQGRAEFGDRFPTRRLFTTEPKRMAEVNDVLMSVRAPVGDLNVAYEKCCIGRGLSAIHSKDGHQSFVLYTMFALQDALDVYNGEGTVFGSINRDALNKMEIKLPSADIIDEFEQIVSKIDLMIRRNYEEICNLTKLRDSMLPKLMSGELDVSGLEI